MVAIDSDGTAKAQEACDPVEEQAYEIVLPNGDSGSVSNFVTVNYFIPNSPAPYDFMSKSGRTGAVLSPGPMQVAPAGGGISTRLFILVSVMALQVTAIGKPTHLMAKKAHPLSRTAPRRLG